MCDNIANFHDYIVSRNVYVCKKDNKLVYRNGTIILNLEDVLKLVAMVYWKFINQVGDVMSVIIQDFSFL